MKKNKEEKTLFMFNQFEDGIKFFELPGDYSDLNGAFINSTNITEDQERQLNEILSYDENGESKQKMFDEPTKDWTYFVEIGFIP
jgi:hypothetical protein